MLANRSVRQAVFAAAGILPLSGTALAADDEVGPKSYPYLAGEMSIELHHDRVFQAENPAAEGSDSFAEITLDVGAYLNRYLSLHGGFVLEPVEDLGPGEDRFFSDHGLYVEQLYGKISLEQAEVVAGKFNPAFGKAWDDTPGVFGTDLAEDYELTERVGAGVIVSREGTAIGDVALNASAFYADTSPLSNSIFTSRGRLSRDDGGLSNTGDLSSLAVSLEGEEIPSLAGVSYNLGFVHQAGGEGDIDDQNGVVLGVQAQRSVHDITLTLIGEAAYFDYGGDLYAFEDAALFVDELWYLTLGAEAKRGIYHAAIAYTSRQAELHDGSEFDDYQVQLSAGVDLARGWALDVGYKYLSEQKEGSHTVGLLLAKTLEFDTSELEPRSPMK